MTNEEGKLDYSSPEILEIGDAKQLTLGQTGSVVDADAQPSPNAGGTPAIDSEPLF